MSAAFIERMPFLKLLPDHVVLQLRSDEWLLPTADLDAERRRLESSLDAHVMTYRRSVFRKDLPLASHLCAWLAPASLSEGQWAELRASEIRHATEDVSFVAYAAPLRLQLPEESALRKSGVLDRN